jgi:TetR/AcrR family fatty acid metabolism transcriptional regulator
LHRSGSRHYSLTALTHRSIASEEKRRVILDAAVRVFARKGYHASRGRDSAERVAHGLLYHYFSSKEELLETVFRETWSELLEAFARVAASDEAAVEQLRQVAAILLRSWRRDPDLVRVLVREVGRSQTLPSRVDEIGAVFQAIERIVERGQAEGELRDDVQPRLAAWIFYGAIEEILTGWVLGSLGDTDDDVAGAERAVVGIVVGGLALSGTAAARG